MYNFLLLSTSILCAKFLDFFSLFYLILEIFTFKKEDFLSLSARSRREGRSVGKNLEGIEQSLEDGSRNRTHNQGITRPRMKPLHHEDKVAISNTFCGFYSARHTGRRKTIVIKGFVLWMKMLSLLHQEINDSYIKPTYFDRKRKGPVLKHEKDSYYLWKTW